MRVVIFHNRLHHFGGPETYLRNIISIFQNNGHEVILIGEFHRGQRIASKFRNFVIPSFGTSNKLGKFFTGIFGIFNPFSFFVGLYVSWFYRPDFALGLQYRLKLSSSIIVALNLRSIPTIVRLSDFNIFCAKNTAELAGESCDLCVNNMLSGFNLNCLNSRFYHIVDLAERQLVRLFRFDKMIDLYVAPSANTISFLVEKHVLSKDKIHLLPTPYVPKRLNLTRNLGDTKTYIVLGRASRDKGVDKICESFLSANLSNNCRLLVVGERDSFIEDYARRCSTDRVKFMDKMSRIELEMLFQKVMYVIAWPTWQDNLPNSLIESCVSEIVPIVPRFGCFDSLMNEGLPCISGADNSKESLIEALRFSDNMGSDEYSNLSMRTKKWMVHYSNERNHYEKLMEYYDEINC